MVGILGFCAGTRFVRKEVSYGLYTQAIHMPTLNANHLRKDVIAITNYISINYNFQNQYLISYEKQVAYTHTHTMCIQTKS